MVPDLHGPRMHASAGPLREAGSGEAEGRSARGQLRQGALPGVSLAWGEPYPLSAAATAAPSILVNNSVSHPYEMRV